MTPRTKLAVRLPDENLDYLKQYAAEHGMTVTEVLDRFLTRLREGAEGRPIHPEVEKISGLVPSDVDAREQYSEYLREKHR